MFKQQVRAAVGVVSLALVLAAAGCGDGTQKVATKESNLSAQARLAAAGQASAGKDTARFTMSVSMSRDGSSSTEAKGLGGEALTGEFDGANTHMVMKLGPMDLEIIYVPGAVYEKAKLLGDGWYKIPVGAASSMSPTPTVSNLSSSLLALADSSGVKDEGQADLGGRTLHKYSATVNLTNAAATADAQSKLSSKAGKQAIEEMTALLSKVPVEVWIDDDTGLVQRLQMSLKTGSSTIAETMDFTDYGATDIAIAAPADAQELSLDDLMHKAMSLGGGDTGD